MLLEIDNSELVHMLEHQESLKGKFFQVLKLHTLKISRIYKIRKNNPQQQSGQIAQTTICKKYCPENKLAK